MNAQAARVVLISSPAPDAEETLPLGTGSIAAVLHGSGLVRREDILLLDILPGDSDAAALARIEAFKPTIAGFSLYCWNSVRLISLAAAFRQRHPGVLVIAGGPDAEGLVPDGDSGADAAGVDAPGAGGAAVTFDAIFLGEAETAVIDWLKASPGGAEPSTAIIRGRAPRAEETASPWLSGFLKPARGDTVAWELTRGCPYHCAYCYEGRGLSGLRHLPEERLIRELEFFVDRGVAEIFVLDPTFNASGARALELLDLFAAKAPDIHWNFEIRAELVDQSQVEAFSELSCSLQIGLQSASPKVLTGIGRTMDKARFVRNTRLLDEAGLVYGFDLIYGLPGDSLAGFEASLDFALSLSPNHLDIFPLALLPGTALRLRHDELGIEFDQSPPYLVRSLPGFSVADLEKAAGLAEACRQFYTRGRAVPWFGAVLKPLGCSPAAFLSGFIPPPDAEKLEHREIETLQCEHLGALYRKAGLGSHLAAVLDLVRYYGAWSRAFAEGERTLLELSYPLELVESPGMLDLASVAKRVKPAPRTVEIRPSREGPTVRLIPSRGVVSRR